MKKVRIWAFSKHYMIKATVGDKSYGWRVDKPLTEDSEFSESVARLLSKIGGVDGVHGR